MIKFFKSDVEKNRMMRLTGFEEGCWIDLVNPTDDEVEDVCLYTGIPEEMLKAALDEEETARAEQDEENFMCLLDSPTISDAEGGDTYSTIPVALIYNPKCVVTVSLHGNAVLGDFISNRMAVNTSKPVHFILQFMMGNAKKFLFNLRQIDRKSLRVQAELHRSMKNKQLIELLELENSLVYFSTSLNSNINAYNKMERLPVVARNEDYKELFDDVVIETRQAMEMCKIYRDVLSGTMDAYASVINNNVNLVMKLLTVITIIITIPTLIASLWGMNVSVPLANVKGGFWIIIGISVLLTAVISFFLIRATSSMRVKPPRTPRPRRWRRK